jgi:hypothetical protein
VAPQSLSFFLMLIALLALPPCRGVLAADPVAWKTGAAFQRQLEEQFAIDWDERALSAGLDRLCEVSGVAIFLDRRIDPGQSITLTVKDQPLSSLLKQVAEAAGGGVAFVGSVVYIGPPTAASQFGTLAAIRRQQAAQLPPDARQRVLKQKAWQWQELAGPRELLTELTAEAEVRVENAERVPHDLWPAVSLPPLAWTDRMTLLLVGFGLTFELQDGGSVARLTPLPTSIALERTYTPRGNPAELAKQLQTLLPDVKIRTTNDGKLTVVGSAEDHDHIERMLTGQGSRSSQGPSQAARGKAAKGRQNVYSLKVENEPAGRVVRKVAESLGKELRYDDNLLNKLREPISLQIENASLEYLLESTLKPLGLTYRLTDKALEIVEK